MHNSSEQLMGLFAQIGALVRRPHRRGEGAPPMMEGHPHPHPHDHPHHKHEGMGRGCGKHRHGEHRPGGEHFPMAQGRVMRILNKVDNISQKEIAEILAVRPQTLSELIGKMEADGLVARKQDENDKRSYLVSLTEQGKSRIKEVQAARQKHAEDFLSPLTQEEQEQLAALLEKLVDAHADR